MELQAALTGVKKVHDDFTVDGHPASPSDAWMDKNEKWGDSYGWIEYLTVPLEVELSDAHKQYLTSLIKWLVFPAVQKIKDDIVYVERPYILGSGEFMWNATQYASGGDSYESTRMDDIYMTATYQLESMLGPMSAASSSFPSGTAAAIEFIALYLNNYAKSMGMVSASVEKDNLIRGRDLATALRVGGAVHYVEDIIVGSQLGNFIYNRFMLFTRPCPKGVVYCGGIHAELARFIKLMRQWSIAG